MLFKKLLFFAIKYLRYKDIIEQGKLSLVIFTTILFCSLFYFKTGKKKDKKIFITITAQKFGFINVVINITHYRLQFSTDLHSFFNCSPNQYQYLPVFFFFSY